MVDDRVVELLHAVDSMRPFVRSIMRARPDDVDVVLQSIRETVWHRCGTFDTALGEWVAWFTHRYNLPARKIPPCWYKHGALVEELAALHTAWLVSYDNLDAGYGPIGWHERLAAAIPRLTSWYNGECHNGHTELPQTGDHTIPEDWGAWIRETHAD